MHGRLWGRFLIGRGKNGKNVHWCKRCGKKNVKNMYRYNQEIVLNDISLRPDFLGGSEQDLNSQPLTLDPWPLTLNSKPLTLNPKPLTLNPKP